MYFIVFTIGVQPYLNFVPGRLGRRVARGRTTQNTVSYDFPCASPARRVLKTSHTIDTKMGRIRTNMQKTKYKIFNGENIIRQQHKNIKTLKLTRHVPFFYIDFIFVKIAQVAQVVQVAPSHPHKLQPPRRHRMHIGLHRWVA